MLDCVLQMESARRAVWARGRVLIEDLPWDPAEGSDTTIDTQRGIHSIRSGIFVFQGRCDLFLSGTGFGVEPGPDVHRDADYRVSDTHLTHIRHPNVVV